MFSILAITIATVVFQLASLVSFSRVLSRSYATFDSGLQWAGAQDLPLPLTYLKPPAEKQMRALPPPHVRRSIATSLRNLYRPYSAMAKGIRHEFCPSSFEELVGPTRARYESKVKICDGVDPYTLRVGADTFPHADLLPAMTHVYIINYLVLSTNYVSLQQMKAFKALDAHNYFTSR